MNTTMTAKEQMQQEFLQRYDDITGSGDTDQMERLGRMVKRVMRWLISEEPELAEKALAMLDADTDAPDTTANRLTEQEARQIAQRMQPRPTWTLEALRKSLPTMGLRLHAEGYFNEWALLATMLMIQSDSGETLREETGWQPNDDRMVRLVYRLATDKLEDADGVFNIRKYFDLPQE